MLLGPCIALSVLLAIQIHGFLGQAIGCLWTEDVLHLPSESSFPLIGQHLCNGFFVFLVIDMSHKRFASIPMNPFTLKIHLPKIS